MATAAAPSIDARAMRWHSPAGMDGVPQHTEALRSLNLHITGEMVFVSGAGTRTLLRLLARLIRSLEGNRMADGLDLHAADESALAARRRAGTCMAAAAMNGHAR